MLSPSDAAWCKQHFELMADGGIWAVPRSGLMFRREGPRLVLTERMPWTPELAQAALDGLNVPPNAGALRDYQDADYRLIQAAFELADINVHDGTP